MRKDDGVKDVQSALVCKADEVVQTVARLRAAAEKPRPQSSVLDLSQVLVDLEKLRKQAEKLVSKW